MATTSEPTNTSAATDDTQQRTDTLSLSIDNGPNRERVRDTLGCKFEELIYCKATVYITIQSQEMLRTTIGVLFMDAGTGPVVDRIVNLRVDGVTWTDRDRTKAKLTGVCSFAKDGNRVWIPYAAEYCTQSRKGRLILTFEQTLLGDVQKTADGIRAWSKHAQEQRAKREGSGNT
jgi:hypothetical protein